MIISINSLAFQQGKHLPFALLGLSCLRYFFFNGLYFHRQY